MNKLNGETISLEKRTVKKIMKRILPFVLLLYVIAFIDRVNMGYAALEMNAELALSAEVFGLFLVFSSSDTSFLKFQVTF